MKIGVITWFHYENYGTVLQAIALQEYLKSIGTEPALIDFHLPELGVGTKPPLRVRLHRHVLNKIIPALYSKDISNRSMKFRNAIYDTYKVKPTDSGYIQTCNQFDLLVCGSDQIWNPNWFNDYYFANYPEVKTPKISYAASIGVKHIPEYFRGSYYNALRSFDKISVREKNTQEEIQREFHLQCTAVVDPVFLGTKEEWSTLVGKNAVADGDYALCYLLTDNKAHWKAVHDFAARKKLKFIIVPMTEDSYFEAGEKKADAGPKDFVNLIANAKYILTDSFHATAFSILMERPFYVFERTAKTEANSQNSRIYNVLKMSGLEKRLIAYNSTRIIDEDDIDFKTAKSLIQPEIEKSKKFINSEIEKVKTARARV